MSITMNDQSRAPPGFRFHPTEEELLSYYLRKKAACGSQKIDLDDVIREVDLNKLEPWEIQEKCMIGPTPQDEWYFFSHKDKKYPTGTRTNRATAAGFWKATGRDKIICSSAGRIGMRKTLVFYKGRAPHGMKFGWIMHEYRLVDGHRNHLAGDTNGYEDGDWVICRLFKKKNATGNDRNTAEALTELQYMGRLWKEEGANHINGENSYLSEVGAGIKNSDKGDKHQDGATLDHLVAPHFNGESSEEWKQLSWLFDDDDGVTYSHSHKVMNDE